MLTMQMLYPAPALVPDLAQHDGAVRVWGPCMHADQHVGGSIMEIDEAFLNLSMSPILQQVAHNVLANMQANIQPFMTPAPLLLMPPPQDTPTKKRKAVADGEDDIGVQTQPVKRRLMYDVASLIDPPPLSI